MFLKLIFPFTLEIGNDIFLKLIEYIRSVSLSGFQICHFYKNL